MGSTYFPERPTEEVMEALTVLTKAVGQMHGMALECSAQCEDAFRDGRTVGRAELALKLLRAAFDLSGTDERRLDAAENEGRW